ncbi:hypothetical protein C0992_001172 [Termitomyces sp. T32_za158]|nr:hypothetical protein C0992_001172 [Termitomyces sp. T32_za158]
MGGMEATELIRAYETERGLTATPIIALTAHASTSSCLSVDLSDTGIVIGDRERCIQAGMDDHITKPLRRGDLLNAIGKLAGEKGAAKHHRRVPPGLEALRLQDIPSTR